MSFEIAVLALLAEAAAGYPAWLYRGIRHPVVWVGYLISMLERTLNRPSLRPAERRARGIGTVVVILLAAIVPCLLLERALLAVPAGIVLVGLVASTLFSQRSLYAHVADVAAALEDEGLEQARIAVSRIVGRDTASLDGADVARAAIESLAENFSDGIVAPAVWTAVAGLPGGAAYKALNTADSMIGHMTPRYQDFGWAAARLDDFVNMPASRLSGCLIVAASAMMPGASAAGAWRAMLRDAPKHRSPNAGWPEAAMAGALQISLAGPRSYNGVLTNTAAMGDGRRHLDAADVRTALRLFMVADGLLILLTVAGAVLLARL